MPSWFDLFEIPITLATPDDEPSFAAAVRLVHAQIDAQVAAGVASEGAGGRERNLVETRELVVEAALQAG